MPLVGLYAKEAGFSSVIGVFADRKVVQLVNPAQSCGLQPSIPAARNGLPERWRTCFAPGGRAPLVAELSRWRQEMPRRAASMRDARPSARENLELARRQRVLGARRSRVVVSLPSGRRRAVSASERPRTETELRVGAGPPVTAARARSTAMLRTMTVRPEASEERSGGETRTLNLAVNSRLLCH